MVRSKSSLVPFKNMLFEPKHVHKVRVQCKSFQFPFGINSIFAWATSLKKASESSMA